MVEHGQWAYNLEEVKNVSTGVLHTFFISRYIAIAGSNACDSTHILCSIYIISAGYAVFRIFQSSLSFTKEVEIGKITALPVAAAMTVVIFLASNETWGLENNLTISVVLWIIVRLNDKKNAYGLVGLSALSRPDAIVLLPLVMVFESFSKKPKWQIIYGSFQAITLTLLWIVFSLIKFGQIAPATLAEKKWQVSSGFWTPISFDLALPYLSSSKFDVFQASSYYHPVLHLSCNWCHCIDKKSITFAITSYVCSNSARDICLTKCSSISLVIFLTLGWLSLSARCTV